MVFIAFLALLVWTLATSLVVWRGETAAETGAAAELPG
jgi:hypothetical protein